MPQAAVDGAKTVRAVKAGRSSCEEGRMVFCFFWGVVVMVRGRVLGVERMELKISR